MKTSKRSLILPAAILLFSVQSWAAVLHMDLAQLLQKADVVALADTIGVHMDLDHTQAQLKVIQSFKGPEAAGSMLTVETGGGKVYVDENEPSFVGMQANLVFLQRTDQPGLYRCVNQADGQKVIRGNNIYPYHDNIAYAVPLKDYLKGLETAIKALTVKPDAK